MYSFATMPQSLSNVLIHLIFSTKDRQPLINAELRPQLLAYMGGVLRNLDCQPLQVGGVEDHVHLLFALARTRSIAEVVRDVKGSSSRWITSNQGQAFQWQAGYAAIGIGRSERDTVLAYVCNQEEHHRQRTFQEEYRELMQLAGIDIDERYAWD
jgi:REP element-mobilizing transposase RayT